LIIGTRHSTNPDKVTGGVFSVRFPYVAALALFNCSLLRKVRSRL